MSTKTELVATLLKKVRFPTETTRKAEALMAGSMELPPQVVADLLEEISQQERYGTAPPPGPVRVTGVVCASATNKYRGWYGWIRSCDAEGRWWYGKVTLSDGLQDPPKKGDLVNGVWGVVPFVGNADRPELTRLRQCPPTALRLEDLPSFTVGEADLRAAVRQERDSTPPILDLKWETEHARKGRKK